ncbi:hypothetical protein EG68_09049, partial [Paragonimus skrjabini miyazakii]
LTRKISALVTSFLFLRFEFSGHISTSDYDELDGIFKWAFKEKAGPINLIATPTTSFKSQLDMTWAELFPPSIIHHTEVICNPNGRP